MRTGGSSEKGPQMGSRWPIGGVALEITQRCNLYANTQIPSDYRVEFIDYDWTVNVQHRDKVGSSFRGFYEPP